MPGIVAVANPGRRFLYLSADADVVVGLGADPAPDRQLSIAEG